MERAESRGGARVALVGPPNAGKSTLFNRLIGSRRALVTDIPGTTRDRLYGSVKGGIRPFLLCDTGGVTPGAADGMSAAIRRQTEEAIREAAVLVLVADGRRGLSPLDSEVAALLHRSGKPLILAVNKIDRPAQEPGSAEFAALGIEALIPVSAEHDRGIDELLVAIDGALEQTGASHAPPAEGEEIRVAIVGRPNVGKSSLLNRFAREERMTVSDIPGTTRDSVDTLLEREGRRYRIIDTAGLRRRGRLAELPERLASMAARRAIESADVVALVLDASVPIGAQDQAIAGLASENQRPLLLLANKWDLVPDPEAFTKSLGAEIARRFRFAREAPLLTLSAKTGQRAEKFFDIVSRVDRAARQRIPTPELNRFLRREIETGRGPNLLYMTQTGTRPPAFVVFTHDASRVHFSLRRRLENRLREEFGLGPTPVALRFRSRRPRRKSA